MAVYYTDPGNIANDDLFIEGEEARHIVSVMRLKSGETITVVDGCGNAYLTELAKTTARRVNGRIISRRRYAGEPRVHVTVAASLSTGYKFDEVVVRGTELGAAAFIPIISDKSKVKLDDGRRRQTKINRWRQVAVAAMKQSGRSVLPEIHSVTEFAALFGADFSRARKLLFDPVRAESDLGRIDLGAGEKSFILIVGPESGFTHEEIALARENGARIVTLGRRILRTENASPTALAILMFLLGEFS